MALIPRPQFNGRKQLAAFLKLTKLLWFGVHFKATIQKHYSQ